MVPGFYTFTPQYPGDTFNGATFQFKRDGSNDDLSGITAEFVVLHPVRRMEMVHLDSATRGGVSISLGSATVTVEPFELPSVVGAYRYRLTFRSLSGQDRTYIAGIIPVIEREMPWL